MIILDFADLDLETCKLDYEEQLWGEGLTYNAFSGRQIFIVNEVDFSFRCPLLGFAKQLKLISKNLTEFKKNANLVDPKFMWPWILEFVAVEENVQITAAKWKDPSVKGDTVVTSMQDLLISSNEYFERVLLQCTILCPKITLSKVIQDWIDEPATH